MADDALDHLFRREQVPSQRELALASRRFDEVGNRLLRRLDPGNPGVHAIEPFESTAKSKEAHTCVILRGEPQRGREKGELLDFVNAQLQHLMLEHQNCQASQFPRSCVLLAGEIDQIDTERSAIGTGAEEPSQKARNMRIAGQLASELHGVSLSPSVRSACRTSSACRLSYSGAHSG